MTIQYSSDQLQRKFSGSPGAPGFSRLGEVLRLEGRLDEAIQICQDGLRTKPDHLSGYLVLGKTLIDSGRLEEAKTQFELALRFDSRCLSALRYLADLMNKFQSTDSATRYYRSILVLEPWDTEIRALLAEALQTVPTLEPPSPSEEETFLKPDGLVGDVLEVNFSEVGDFLPDQNGASYAVPEMVVADLANPDKVSPDLVSPDLVESLESAPISGQDIEDRMESLFGAEQPKIGAIIEGLAEATAAPTAAPINTAFVMPVDETSAVEPSAAATATDMLQSAAITNILETPMPMDAISEEQVSGADIEKRLDDLFSLQEEPIPSTTETSTFAPIADPGTTESPLGELMDEPALDINGPVDVAVEMVIDADLTIKDEASKDALRLAGAATWSPSEPEDPISPSASIMSTESMLPVGWLADAGTQPAITGSDIEAQLDKLFNLEESPSQDREPVLEPDPGMDPDQTITMPAMREPSLKEGATDWLMRQAEEEASLKLPNASLDLPPIATPSSTTFGSGAETLILTVEETREPEPSTSEIEAEPEILGTLAPEDTEGLADTVTIEMVDGNDVAERLDELFSDEVSATETMGMIRPVDEVLIADETLLEKTDSASETAQKPLEPMIDEDEPELEEEMPSQTEGGANVATVTLAEIYFQQGLKEQALQIYRQLLEREPENESVQKRISEIDASKSEGDNRGNEPDPRRSRPGLKVPKRKK